MHVALWALADLPTLSLRAAGRGRGRQRCLDTFLYGVSPTSNGEYCSSCSTSAKDKLRPFQPPRKPVDFPTDSIAHLALSSNGNDNDNDNDSALHSQRVSGINSKSNNPSQRRVSVIPIENNNPASPDAAVLLRCTHVPPYGHRIALLRAQPFSAIVASLRAGLVAASRSRRRPCPSRLIDRVHCARAPTSGRN